MAGPARFTVIYTWRKGATRGGLLAQNRGVIVGGQYIFEGILASNDGTVWSCQRTLDVVRILHGLRGAGADELLRWNSLASAPVSERALLEWAKATAVVVERVYTTQAPAEAEVVTRPCSRARLGPVAYAGFAKFARRSAHSLEQVHRIVDDAVAACQAAWGWSPEGLEINFHETARSMGLAYCPGTGATTGKRKVSISIKVLETFDARSVGRVVRHELCHHYREEKWGRVPSALSHDGRFCEALALVDPIVASAPTQCATFQDEEDPALANAAQLRRAARVKEPVWSPDAGMLVVRALRSGTLKIDWEPATGFRWTPYTRPMNAKEIISIADRFAPETWSKVRVQNSSRVFFGADSLLQLLHMLVARYPRLMQSLAEYLKRRSP